MNHIDQIVSKCVQMQKVTELGIMGMTAQVKRGNLDKADEVGKKIMAGLREKVQEIQELSVELDESIRKIMQGGSGLFAHFLEIALLMDGSRKSWDEAHDLFEILNKVKQYKNVADLVGSHLLESIYQEKYGLHTRQLQTNRYQLTKLSFIVMGGVLFYEDVEPDSEALADLNALTFVTGGDVFDYLKLQPTSDLTATQLMTLVDALPVTGQLQPEWMKKYGKVAWFRFDDMIKLSSKLKEMEGKMYKNHYLVEILGRVTCLDCGKTWKSSPKKPCTK